MQPRVRNSDHLNSGADALRDYFRKHFPEAGPVEGFFISDVDAVFRHYSAADPSGSYAFFEFKCNDAGLSKGQRASFRQVHEDLRNARRYRGFWKIGYEFKPSLPDKVRFTVARQLFEVPQIVIKGHDAVLGFMLTLAPATPVKVA